MCSKDAGGGGAVVLTLAGEILEGEEDDGAAGLFEEEIEGSGQLALQKVWVDADAPIAGCDAEDGPVEDEAIPDGGFEAGGKGRPEGERRIGGDLDPGGGNAHAFEQGFRAGIADGDGVSRFGGQRVRRIA